LVIIGLFFAVKEVSGKKLYKPTANALRYRALSEELNKDLIYNGNNFELK
jgi:hypothetical protein